MFWGQLVNETGRPVHFKRGNVVVRVEWLPDDSHFLLSEPMVNLSPLSRLLRSAGATEDLFVTRGLHQKPPPRIPMGSSMEKFFRDSDRAKGITSVREVPLPQEVPHRCG